MKVCKRNESRIEFCGGGIRGGEFGVDDGVDCGLACVDDRLQLCALLLKPNGVFGRNVEQDDRIYEHHEPSILAARHRHDFIRHHGRRCAALRPLQPLLEAHLFRRFVHSAKRNYITLWEELDIRPRKEMKPLADILRDGNLAFGRNLHSVDDACEPRCTQATKKSRPGHC